MSGTGMNIRYTVDTKVFTDGRIEQIVDLHDPIAHGAVDRISREILDTKEQHVRRALIALGWTPPGEVKG